MQRLLFLLVLISTLSISTISTVHSQTMNEIEMDSLLKLEKSPLPDFNLKSLNGTFYSPEILKDKVIVLSLFWIGCPASIVQFHYLNKLYDEFKDKDFLLLSIAPHSEKTLLEFNNENSTDPEVMMLREIFDSEIIRYEIISSCLENETDMDPNSEDRCMELLKPFNFEISPTLFFIDKFGVIQKVDVGFPVKDKMKEEERYHVYRQFIKALL